MWAKDVNFKGDYAAVNLGERLQNQEREREGKMETLRKTFH